VTGPGREEDVVAVPAQIGSAAGGGGWRRWSRLAGRLLLDGLIAVGIYASGVIVPYGSYRRQDEIERALWSELHEVRRLLPLLDRSPEDGAGWGSHR
jgi:hypothetical protein